VGHVSVVQDRVQDAIPGLIQDDQSGGQTAQAGGILASQHLAAFIRAGYIRAERPLDDEQIQPASLDLRLGPVAYRVRASFLPSETTRVERKIAELKVREVDLSAPAVLEKGSVYIVPLQEELQLPPTISGKSNPKSTTGRLDIFTRLITDWGSAFERVPPGYSGKLYVEIFPRTFDIQVQQGTRLNQLRLVQGTIETSDRGLSELHARETLLYLEDDRPAEATIDQGLWISVDVRGEDCSELIGYRARRYAPVVDLSQVGHYDPSEFWEPIARPASGYLILDPDDFYILASRERIRVPPSVAAEMIGYDPIVGEFRVHYAGFFDPGFGYGSDDIRGTRAVLEVRSYGVPFVLEDGQPIGRLVYERLLAQPGKVYGVGIGSSYQSQGLALSKQFRRPD
jgi:dCTP deaminase